MATELRQIKARGVDLVNRTREGALNLAEDFRRQTPFFKARVGVLAGFGAMIAVTLLLAVPGERANPCGVSISSMQLSFKTVVRVLNEDGDDYQQLVVEVRGDDISLDTGERRVSLWRSTPHQLAEGGELVLDHKQLVDDQGRSPETVFNPRTITVRCDGRVSQSAVE